LVEQPDHLVHGHHQQQQEEQPHLNKLNLIYYFKVPNVGVDKRRSPKRRSGQMQESQTSEWTNAGVPNVGVDKRRSVKVLQQPHLNELNLIH
jgi:hypothetical protein